MLHGQGTYKLYNVRIVRSGSLAVPFHDLLDHNYEQARRPVGFPEQRQQQPPYVFPLTNWATSRPVVISPSIQSTLR